MYCSAVIVAAGKGTRMGMDMNKQYLKIKGKEVIAHTIEQFEKCASIDEIVVVTGQEEVEYFKQSIWEKYKFAKITSVVVGGKERKNSVYNGLLKVNCKADIVVIHDGARPLVKNEHIQQSIEVASEIGACAVGVPAKDTIKICDSNQFVRDTPDRNTLWIVQTPQTFCYDWIMKAHTEPVKSDIEATDDAMMVESLGYPLKMVTGCYSNIKITTKEDLIVAEMMMK